MTVEHKFVAGLGDLQAIVFACRHEGCTARAVVSPEHSKVPEHCPGCGREWMPRKPLAEINTTQSAYVNFVEAISRMRAHDKEAGNEWPKFRILLEFNEPK